jgi:cation:H+ antiporter
VSTATAVGLDAVRIGLAVVGLWLGALVFVENAAAVARRLGVPELVVGLTVVALGTSAPEAAVTLDAAVTGRPGIAVANVVGSNIVNLGFVLGAVTLLGGIAPSPSLARRDGPVALLAAVLVGIFVLDGTVGPLEGGVLVALFAGYLGVLYRVADRTPAVETEPAAANGSLRAAVLAAGGGLLVVVAANLLVDAAADLALLAGVSEWVVGETVVALGTSTPELAASVAAARNGFGDIAAGNLVGSSIFNALGILGLAAVVVPLPVGGEAVVGAAWLVAVSGLAAGFFATKHRLTRLEGLTLAVLAAGKWLLDLL